MAKQIAQLYYDGNSKPPFENGTQIEGWSTNLLQGLGSVTQIGIYALPGTQFKINKGSEQTFIIGSSGLFSLSINENPIKELYVNYNLENTGHFIIIDLVYENMGGVVSG